MAQKAIGPNFNNEIAAAGLLGLHCSWDSQGNFIYGDDLTADQQAAIMAVYAAHNPDTPEPVAAAAALLNAGLTITSAATPAVNGTYVCDDAQQSIVARLQTYIDKNNKFPDNLPAVQLRTTTGVIAVPSIALFQAIGSAIADAVAAVDEAELTALAGGAWNPPAMVAAIA